MSDETQTILQDAETYVLPFVQKLLLAKAVAVIAAMVATDETRFPGDSIAALTTQVDGDLAHKVRVALGWLGALVDIGWSDASLQSALTQLIQLAIAAYPPTPVSSPVVPDTEPAPSEG